VLCFFPPPPPVSDVVVVSSCWVVELASSELLVSSVVFSLLTSVVELSSDWFSVSCADDMLCLLFVCVMDLLFIPLFRSIDCWWYVLVCGLSSN